MSSWACAKGLLALWGEMKEKKCWFLSIRRTRFLGQCYKKRPSKAVRFLAVAGKHQGLEGGLVKIKGHTLCHPYQLSIL